MGSLIKPVVYCEALARGFTLASMLNDAPVSVPLDDGTTWSPENYDSKSHGTVMLVDALARSYNQATVRLGLEVGLERVRAAAAGLLPGRAIPPHPSVLLGAVSSPPSMWRPCTPRSQHMG
jgi:penicillin-binding protein 1B